MPDAACWKTRGVLGNASCEGLADIAHCRNCPEYSRAGRSLLDRGVPAGVREEATAALAVPRESGGEGALSVVVFRAGSQWLALETVLFQRWVEARPVHAVPGRSNEIFRGLVNVDGELLLAFDAARMLNSDERAGDATARMFVATDGHDRMVFAADEVLGIRRIPRQALEEPPATLSRAPAALTRSAFLIEDRKIALLDAERFFACALRSLS